MEYLRWQWGHESGLPTVSLKGVIILSIFLMIIDGYNEESVILYFLNYAKGLGGSCIFFSRRKKKLDRRLNDTPGARTYCICIVRVSTGFVIDSRLLIIPVLLILYRQAKP